MCGGRYPENRDLMLLLAHLLMQVDDGVAPVLIKDSGLR